MKLETNSVRKFVEEIMEKKYFLPNIQREKFIWDVDQTKKLFDSLLRLYPFGTMLLWEIKKGSTISREIKKRGFVQNFKKNINPSEFIDNSPINDDILLVLDGQQRLQSFFIGLRGSYEERELFFNVLSGNEENEEGLLYDFDFFKSYLNFLRENSKIWIKIKWFDWKKRSHEMLEDFKKQKDFEINTEEEKIVFRNISDLNEAITRDDKIGYFKIEETDYNKVLDIFVRTNSGGTPLSKADLLFSVIKLQWNLDAQKEFNELIEEINDNGKFKFTVDFILKTCLVLTASRQQDVRYDINNFKNRDKLKEIENNWGKIKDCIRKTIDLLKEFGIRSDRLLPSLNAIIPMIYYSYHNNTKTFTEEEKEVTKRWLINALLSGAFGGQSDNVLFLTKQAIDSSQKGLFPIDYISKTVADGTKGRKSLIISPNILDKIKYAENESFLVLFLIYPREKINFNCLDRKGRPQQDHLFSENELEQIGCDEDKINDIGNIRFLSTHENQSKGKKPFKKWITEMSPKELELQSNLHLIPDDKYWNDYDKFITERKKIILDRFVKVISNV